MHLVIGCVDGKEYASKDIPREEIEAELAKVNGVLGTGPFKGITAFTAEEFGEAMAEFFVKTDNEYPRTVIELDTGAGTRYFKPENIVWAQAYYD